MSFHRIALIATDGTISGVADGREITAGRGAAAIAGGLGEGLELRTVDTARVPSRAMTPKLMRVLARDVRQQIDLQKVRGPILDTFYSREQLSRLVDRVEG